MAGMMMGGGGDPAAQPMDTAMTARQPQQVDPNDEAFATAVAGLREYIFGAGEAGIVQALSGADDIGRVMGEITYSLVSEAGHQAEEAGAAMVWDVLIGVATEVIDDLSELAMANDIEVTAKDQEYALLYAQQLYVESSDPSNEERQDAQMQLAEFQQSGELDEAVSYVQQRGAEEGADPFGVQSMGGGMMEDE